MGSNDVYTDAGAAIVSGRPLPEDGNAVHRHVAVRGTRLHLAEYGGSGTPLLMLHGFPQHWFAWHKVTGQLAGEYRLLCPDLRGFGWSGLTRRGYDMDSLADDALALLDALGIRGPVGLVGHDWGAHLGFRLCLRAPERFTGYLALNMSHPWPRHRAVLPNLWRLWYTAFVEYPVIGRAVLRHRPGFTRFLLRHQVADPAVWTEAELSEYAAATSVGAAAVQSLFWQYVLHDIPALVRGTWRRHRLVVPTLLLGGERDAVVVPSMLAGAEPYADDLRVRLVPGAGHYLPQERPREVAEAIREQFRP
ncbi:alpha/beta hydrolase [Streptomyces actinomycinicus]|uniref:Alpha/beta hydrolase n=1 Tax=Streptomyces actinomycinicus TaxID=1695166 RepID=A0A937EIU3_9ACTN|nr:alpha/beta hydrolase [Streptomyces actinomycinicus]MBL1083177.1 alpha/beta hydrolase [Streptomyces actinomycinicus]